MAADVDAAGDEARHEDGAERMRVAAGEVGRLPGPAREGQHRHLQLLARGVGDLGSEVLGELGHGLQKLDALRGARPP
jgi:hypothetical protein